MWVKKFADAHKMCQTSCVTQAVSHQMCHTSCVTPNVSHKLCYTKCVTQAVSHKMCHTSCVTPNVSHKLCHTKLCHTSQLTALKTRHGSTASSLCRPLYCPQFKETRVTRDLVCEPPFPRSPFSPFGDFRDPQWVTLLNSRSFFLRSPVHPKISPRIQIEKVNIDIWEEESANKQEFEVKHHFCWEKIVYDQYSHQVTLHNNHKIPQYSASGTACQGRLYKYIEFAIQRMGIFMGWCPAI